MNVPLLARLANLAYETDADKVATEAPGDEVTIFDRKSTQGFLARTAEADYLAFRGTEPSQLEDWMTDFAIFTHKSELGRTHRGFSRALEAILPDLEAARRENPERPVYACGHSLGGALATAWAARHLETPQIVAGVCTFGAPAVGDRMFSTQYNEVLGGRTLRFENKADFVAKLLKYPIWHHVGQHHYFDTREQLHVNPSRWLVGWKDSWRNTWRPNSSRTHLGDHAMDEYERLVATL